MNEQYTETEPLYVGYVYLPTRRCRLRFVPATEQTQEKDIPVWLFAAALVALAVLIGVCGALLMLPYGGICR